MRLFPLPLQLPNVSCDAIRLFSTSRSIKANAGSGSGSSHVRPAPTSASTRIQRVKGVTGRFVSSFGARQRLPHCYRRQHAAPGILAFSRHRATQNMGDPAADADQPGSSADAAIAAGGCHPDHLGRSRQRYCDQQASALFQECSRINGVRVDAMTCIIWVPSNRFEVFGDGARLRAGSGAHRLQVISRSKHRLAARRRRRLPRRRPRIGFPTWTTC